jgi:ADP-heptose:LPS heptosyltransferase
MTAFARLLQTIRLSASREGGARTRVARAFVARADAERDKRNYRAAAELYEAALGAEPGMAAIHIQCGHMFKEAGALADAESHYLEARRLSPDDADLALQMGHFYKVAGRPEEAEAAYGRSAELSPGSSAPLRELAEVRRVSRPPALDSAWSSVGPVGADGLVPELAPRTVDESGRSFIDSVHIRRLGARRERTPWGLINTLRGVEALRGYCISSLPIRTLRISLDGTIVGEAAVEAFPLDSDSGVQRKFVFNAWCDFSGFSPGPHRITLQFLDEQKEIRRHSEHVVVARPFTEAEFPDSDGVVELSAEDARSPESQIRARQSVVRAARRTLLPRPPRNVLVMRTDQLGDLVISVPALRRLREILPEARLVGLLTSANAEIAASLGLFDEIIVIDFPDDPLERRRIMPLDAQESLRRRLEPYRFDIAVDLAESAVSRPLLLLSGARFLYGFHHRDWPWLTAGFEGATLDPYDGLEVAPQSTKVLALVERLGASLTSRAEVIRRTGFAPDALAPFALKPDDRYVVLHTGARIAFSRWPYYRDLAALVLERTDLQVVLVTDDPLMRADLPEGLSSSARFQLIDTRLPFDAFDALLSHCAAFVGNDSGPKHLAALRGVPVVSIHSARINWNEWGQELTGSIISRRVPCAGCAIFHDSDECGKAFACIVDIKVEEVFAAVARHLE